MARHPDMAIIGGGIIGLTTAYFLAREQARVTVLDQGAFGQEASWAGAGILPPGNPALARTPFDQLRALSAAMFPDLSADLRERSGIDNGYRRCGGLEFVLEKPDIQEQEWRGEGIVCETLDDAACRSLEPALAPNLGLAHHLPELAQLRNPRHVKALLAACQSLGVRFQPGCPVHGFVREAGHIQAARTASGLVHAGRFLVAAGAWTDFLLKELGCSSGVRPVRGQMVLLNTQTAVLRRVLMYGARYIVPRPDGRVLIGSTEENAGFLKQTTAAAIGDLLRFGIALVPTLANAPVERTWAGLRPGSPDGLPYLGRVPGHNNLYVAAGHFRAGIQLSPASGKVMKELLLGQPLSLPLEPFQLDRAATFRS